MEPRPRSTAKALSAVGVRALSVACCTLSLACGDDGGGARVVESVIGPEGGAVTSHDGRLTLTVPPGALAAPIGITVQEDRAAAPGAHGPGYEVGPDGTTFAVPAIMTLRDPGGDVAMERLRAATHDGRRWLALPAAVVRVADRLAEGRDLRELRGRLRRVHRQRRRRRLRPPRHLPARRRSGPGRPRR